MRAAFIRRFGGPEVLEYGELPDPAPKAGEVLVEIHAASVNAADWKMRSGQYGAAVSFPHVPGRDFSGVIVSSAQHFKPGDAVFGVYLDGVAVLPVEWWDAKWIDDNITPKLEGRSGEEIATSQAKAPRAKVRKRRR